MFFLGVLTGVILYFVFGGLFYELSRRRSTPSYEALAAIRAQERRAISDLLAAEQAMRGAGGPVRVPGTDIIEGSAVEVDRP
jgi:hypothetical protein